MEYLKKNRLLGVILGLVSQRFPVQVYGENEKSKNFSHIAVFAKAIIVHFFKANR